MTRRILMTAAAALLAAGPALAGGFAAPVVVAAPAPVVVAPAPVVAGTDWTGGYVGGQLGFGTLSMDDDNEETELEDFDGTLFGVHAGYMFDFGRFVAGAEIDYDRADITAEDDDEMTDDATDLDSIARAKLRLGFDGGRFLPYVTGGVARASLSAENADLEETLEDGYDGNFYGIGANYAVSERFMVGVEALRHNFDDTPAGFDSDVNTITLRGSFRF